MTGQQQLDQDKIKTYLKQATMNCKTREKLQKFANLYFDEGLSLMEIIEQGHFKRENARQMIALLRKASGEVKENPLTDY